MAPNILFIIDDQHRHDCLGAAGASFLDTPNLDRLAARGLRFSHALTNSPVCGPARISLATGLLPTRLGTTSNELSFLPISAPNLYRHFRDHGYRVSLVGRHDLAKPGAPASVHGNRPLNFSYGFTDAFEVEGGMALCNEPEPNGPYAAYLENLGLLEPYRADFIARREKGWILGVSHDSVLTAQHHQDAFVGRRAVRRIESMETDYPFFLFVSFQGPHDPFDPPAEYGARYRDRAVPQPVTSDLEQKPRRVRDRARPDATPEQVLTARRQYCAKISLIDDQVGAILDALERRGLADNTLVVFASDHGEMLGDHHLWEKQVAYEPAWRVPLILAGPGVPAGATADALVELSDLNPTLTALAGLPAQPHLDARSFAHLLRDPAATHREAAVTLQRGVPGPTYSAVRTRTHKLIINDGDLTELYDLADDPDETRNIAPDHPDTVRELSQRLYDRLNAGRWQR
jgi:choline-sulfatase